MPEIIKTFLVILDIAVAILSFLGVIMQIRIDNITTLFTFEEKLKRSLIGGFMLSIFMSSIFAIIPLTRNYSLNFSFEQISLSVILTPLICLVIPMQILGTVGIFMRLTYLNFLLSKARKNN